MELLKKWLHYLLYLGVLLAIGAMISFMFLAKNAAGRSTPVDIFSWENIKGTLISALVIGVLYFVFSNAFKTGKKLDEKEKNNEST